MQHTVAYFFQMTGQLIDFEEEKIFKPDQALESELTILMTENDFHHHLQPLLVQPFAHQKKLQL